MKLSYCAAQKGTLTKRYNEVMDKIAYDKFKKAILECFKITTAMCVGISFMGCIAAYDLNNSAISAYGMEVVSGISSKLLQLFWVLWGIGYMLAKMKNSTTKEFFKEMGEMFVKFGIANILAMFGGGILFELVMLLV